MSGISIFADSQKNCTAYNPTDPANGQKDIYVQLVLSLALGVSAFLGFCFLRPRWKSLYAARKRQNSDANALPELPDSFFGWMPVLYRVTEQQVLDAAGLDAYVFLSFFKMSIYLFTVMFILTCAILLPINLHFVGQQSPGNSTVSRAPSTIPAQIPYGIDNWEFGLDSTAGKNHLRLPDNSYLWAYLVFTYIFSGLAFYFMRRYTLHIIQVRQDYLGSQSTITDRTIKLSGVPKELRSEGKIKQFLEKLEIGSVESVTICRNWEYLDNMMEKRMYILRRLEEAWTVHLGRAKSNKAELSVESSDQTDEPENGDAEEDNLLGEAHITPDEPPRPTTRLWYGFLNLQSRNIDAIDYYEEELRKLDDKIKDARKKHFVPTPLAFVTMDSIPACQMAVQALLDPSPGNLLAKLAPAPTDVVWQNTYLSKSRTVIRSWIITIFILILTIFWLIPVVGLAGLLSICSIRQIWPQLADLLESHEILQALVQTGLPTLVVSLLNVAVPFLYDFLANAQGMISQGDVELSVVSKNFFFTFFNLFLVFTIGGTATTFWPFVTGVADSLRDTTTLAFHLAQSVQDLAVFYTNFILLQSVGLLPFRLLEFGSVFLYPILRFSSKTPRDYAELVQPPVFKYGFYLPSAILIYILCIVYSILPAGYKVLFFGLIYFIFGYYTYKYQLLYAMDHLQHSTGQAWPMICYRIMVGLGVFQVVMAGLIALRKAFYPAALVVPLIPFTVWYSYYYRRTYEPLTTFIALRSIRRESNAGINIADEDISDRAHMRVRRRSSTVDETREAGMKFVNPSLVIPLEKLWIKGGPEDGSNGELTTPLDHESSAASSVSLGDTHIWRDNGDSNVALATWSPKEAVETTSSQILLSRDIADPDITPASPPVGMELEKSSNEGGHEIFAVTDANPGDSSSVNDGCVLPSESARSSSASSSDVTLWNDTQEELEVTGVSDAAIIVGNAKDEVERGRSTERAPRLSDPFIRAGSRPLRHLTAIELDSRPIEKRVSRRSTFFGGNLDPSAVLEDYYLEPCPHIPLCVNVSEILNSFSETSSGTTTSARARSRHISSAHRNGFAVETPTRALNTVFNSDRPFIPAPTFPPDILAQMLPDIDHLEYLAIRSSSSIWNPLRKASIQPGKNKIYPSIAMGLPTEIIQKIFESLHPFDFNSARHTCRSWFITSLERSILELMFRRAGWSSSIKNASKAPNQHDLKTKAKKEWQLSMRFSRECALGPEWKGNGVSRTSKYEENDPDTAAFVHIAKTDFTDVAVHYMSTHSAGTIFTVSSCGRFLMAANGCLVYIYELNRSGSSNDSSVYRQGNLRPVTSIICPGRVIACSMDTSSHRYAVAMLLDGRMGLVCEINVSQISSDSCSKDCSDSNHGPDSLSTTNKFHQTKEGARTGTTFLDRVSLNSSSCNLGSSRVASEPPFVFPGIAASGSHYNHSASKGTRWRGFDGKKPAADVEDSNSLNCLLPNTRQGSGSRPFGIMPPFQENESDSGSMPIETGSRSIYRNICTDDDPPRSVAICPQRRCVAFGCSAGIELHWVDALTGQDLRRWFPLTAPSDYLFFLPPRRSVDTAKKLRLISSAARPAERAAISARAFGAKFRNSPFWDKPAWGAVASDEEIESPTPGSNSRWRNGTGSSGMSDYSDHYRAIPLSDGYHILFIDPSTGLLCLGSDAPVGEPTKLLRKIWFQGPDGAGSPVVYASGSDLTSGVRVVAAFGTGAEQSIWFFSVPHDVFVAQQGSHIMSRGSWLESDAKSQARNLEWVNWWSEDSLQGWFGSSQVSAPGILPKSVWPAKVRGQEIGKISSLTDLAIDSGPSMTIWAFSAEGIAKTWQVNDGTFDGEVQERCIARDGSIREIDSNGDVEMTDVPYYFTSLSESPVQVDSFDGSSSFDSSLLCGSGSKRPAENQWGPQRSKRRRHRTWDSNDDNVMDNLQLSDRASSELSQNSFERVALARVGEVVYGVLQRERGVIMHVEDLVGGITRIDIEVY